MTRWISLVVAAVLLPGVVLAGDDERAAQAYETSGTASSGGCRSRSGWTGATTMRTGSACGWPEVGVKGGTVVGATDQYGYRAVDNRKSVHELHATILHLCSASTSTS